MSSTALRKTAGRPSKYTPELAYDICTRIKQGDNLSRICQEDGYPTRITVYNWLADRGDFFTMYVRAREMRADSRSDRIDGYVEEVRAGDLDPNAARVIILAEQWQASRENPKRYGDKLDLNAAVSIDDKSQDRKIALIGMVLALAKASESGADLPQEALDFLAAVRGDEPKVIEG